MTWQILLLGWSLCFLLAFGVSLLLWRIFVAPPSTFTLGSAVSCIIGLLYGVPAVTLVFHAALGWHPAACLVAALVPGWALAMLLAFTVDSFLGLVEAAAQKVSLKRREPR